MVDRNDQGVPATQGDIAALTARVDRQDRTLVELLETLDALAKGLPPLGDIAKAKAKVKSMLADFRAGTARGR